MYYQDWSSKMWAGSLVFIQEWFYCNLIEKHELCGHVIPGDCTERYDAPSGFGGPFRDCKLVDIAHYSRIWYLTIGRKLASRVSIFFDFCSDKWSLSKAIFQRRMIRIYLSQLLYVVIKTLWSSFNHYDKRNDIVQFGVWSLIYPILHLAREGVDLVIR